MTTPARRHLPIADESGVRLIPATFPPGFVRPTLRQDCAARPEPCPHCYGIVAHYRAAPGEDGPVVTCPHCAGRVSWDRGEWMPWTGAVLDPDGENGELNRCRPCVLESCRWHVNGLRRVRREPSELPETCVLDVADEGATLDEVGALMSRTRERVRQIEAKALRKVRAYRPKRDRLALGLMGESRAELAAGEARSKPDGAPRRGESSVRSLVLRAVEREPGIERTVAVELVADQADCSRAAVSSNVSLLVRERVLRVEDGQLWIVEVE